MQGTATETSELKPSSNPYELRVNLPYYKGKEQPPGTPSQQYLTGDYINHVVTQKHKDGLGRRDRKLFGRIQDKLDEAIDANAESIVLEKAEADFLKEAFKDAKTVPALSRSIALLEDAIEDLG